MLVGLGNILRVEVDSSEAGWCNGEKHQAAESNGHGSMPGFAN